MLVDCQCFAISARAIATRQFVVESLGFVREWDLPRGARVRRTTRRLVGRPSRTVEIAVSIGRFVAAFVCLYRCAAFTSATSAGRRDYSHFGTFLLGLLWSRSFASIRQ